MDESPNVQWFEAFAKCRCGKPSSGILRGTRNESYGPHCKKCADGRMKASKRVREHLIKTATQDARDLGMND
jgi:hypothetical protein